MTTNATLRFAPYLTALCIAGAGCQTSDSEVPVQQPPAANAPDANVPSDEPASEEPPGVHEEVDAGRALPPQRPSESAGAPASNAGRRAPQQPSAAGHAAAAGHTGETAHPAAGSRAEPASAGTPAAGSGGVAAAGGSGATTPPQVPNDGCPIEYTMATHIVINVSWSGSLALSAGSGEVHVWSKSKFVRGEGGATLESRSCGSVLPVITTSALAGRDMILPEIPDAAWDATSMPTFFGTETEAGTEQIVKPGIALLGLTLPDPSVPWPDVASIVGVDHDGDGAPGITAIPRDGGDFVAPPTTITQFTRADRLYLAIRNQMTLHSTAVATGCPTHDEGTAEIENFENHVIGCHIKGGGECTEAQRDFVDSNRTIYALNGGIFISERVSDAATCADVRALLPIQ